MKIEKGNNSDFESCPAGVHVATLYRIIDLGTQKVTWQENIKEVPQAIFVFETPFEKMSNGEKPFMVMTFPINKYLSEKAKLRGLLNALNGSELSEEELEDLDIKDFIGKSCQIQVYLSEKGYTNIQDKIFMPLTKGTKVPAMYNPPVYFDLEDFNEGTFKVLPEFIKAKIMNSPEYQQINGTPVKKEEKSAFAQQMEDTMAKEETPPPANEKDYGAELNDKIPF